MPGVPPAVVKKDGPLTGAAYLGVRTGLRGKGVLMSGMRLSTQVSPADWIRLRLTGDDPRVSLRVADVVPDGYERYIRLFHPVYTGDELLTWQQIADSTGTRFHPLAYFGHLLGDRAEELGSQVFPGALQYRQLSRLVAVLRPWTPDAPCWFAYSETAGEDLDNFLPLVTAQACWPLGGRAAATFRLRDEDYLLLTGPLDAVVPRSRPELGLEPDYPILSPQLWWPADRGWMVITMIDLPFTLIGASAGLAAALLADTELETAEVGWLDDISVAGDHING